MSIVVGVTYYLHTLSLDTGYHHLQVILSLRAVGLGLATMPLTTAGMNTVPDLIWKWIEYCEYASCTVFMCRIYCIAEIHLL